MFRADHITKQYFGSVVLDDVTFEAGDGEICVLAGTAGSGRTALAKILSGLEKPDSGIIAVDGLKTAALTKKQCAEKGIEAVFRESSLFESLSVAENICLGTQLKKKARIAAKQYTESARNVVAKIGVQYPEKLLAKPVKDLSPSEEKWTEIAKAVLAGPRVLILDDVLSVFSEADFRQLGVLLETLKNQGASILLLTGEEGFSFPVYDRILLLRDGRVLLDEKSGFISRKTLHYTLYPKPAGNAMSGKMYSDTAQKKNAAGNGRPASDKTGDHVLTMNVQNYTGPGFENITFSLPKGRILGITGLPDSGCSQLLQSLAAASGSRMMLVPKEKDGIFPGSTGLENLILPNLSARKEKAGAVRDACERQLLQMGMETSMHTPASLLNKGDRVKLLLARSRMAQDQMLILDEPFCGLHTWAVEEIRNWLKEQCSQGFSFLIYSSCLPELLETADSLIVLRKGKKSAFLEKKDFSVETVRAFML